MPARPDRSDLTSIPERKRLLALSICLCALALACGGCGRRGKLEPPSGTTTERTGPISAPASARSLPDAIGVAAPGAAPEAEAVRDGDELPLSATPAGTDSAPIQTNKGAKRGFRIPKEPFILDPIL